MMVEVTKPFRWTIPRDTDMEIPYDLLPDSHMEGVQLSVPISDIETGEANWTILTESGRVRRVEPGTTIEAVPGGYFRVVEGA